MNTHLLCTGTIELRRFISNTSEEDEYECSKDGVPSYYDTTCDIWESYNKSPVWSMDGVPIEAVVRYLQIENEDENIDGDIEGNLDQREDKESDEPGFAGV